MCRGVFILIVSGREWCEMVVAAAVVESATGSRAREGSCGVQWRLEQQPEACDRRTLHTDT